MKTEAIIFDLDGTLLNTTEDIAAATNFALKKNGFEEHPVSSYPKMVGHGLKNLIEQALPEKYHDEYTDPVFKDLIDYYKKNPVVKTYPYRGITELLKSINNLKIPVSILSNKMDEITRDIVRIIFKDFFFSSVFGSRENIPKKPDPQAALEICSIMKTRPENTWFIGDSATDIKTAQNAKMPSIGVSWGFRPKESLISAGAEIIVDEPSEILKIIQ